MFLLLIVTLVVCPAVALSQTNPSIAQTSSSASFGTEDGRSQNWDALVQAYQTKSRDASSVKRVEAAITAGLPTEIAGLADPAYPISRDKLSDGLGVMLVPENYLPIHDIEPKTGAVYPLVTYLYLPDHRLSSGMYHLFCRLHYTQPSDAPLAKRIGGLLSLAARVLTQKTQRPLADGVVPFDVWLSHQGDSAGEQWKSNVYFYELGTARSSIEWIREIVHEFSHLAVPPIGGYSAPEYWANGYIGERLIVRWIAEDPGYSHTLETVWGDFSGYINFKKKLIDPALAYYAQQPHRPDLLAKTNADGMKYLIGQILTIDDKYGSATLGRVFARIPRFREGRATDVTSALESIFLERPPSSKAAHAK